VNDTPETDAQLKRERDEAREKITRQAARIRELEGATNHAGGTSLTIAMRERDEARAVAKYWHEQFGHHVQEHEWQSFPWEAAK